MGTWWTKVEKKEWDSICTWKINYYWTGCSGAIEVHNYWLCNQAHLCYKYINMLEHLCLWSSVLCFHQGKDIQT